MQQIEVECQCGKTIPVTGLETTLFSEDYRPVTVTCPDCQERYRVSLHMDILGKAP